MGYFGICQKRETCVAGVARRILAKDRSTAKRCGMEQKCGGYQERCRNHAEAIGRSQNGSLREDPTRHRAEYFARSAAPRRPQCVSPGSAVDGAAIVGRLEEIENESDQFSIRQFSILI